MAEAKPTMAARPSHTSGPPACCFFALCSHLMDSDLAAMEETRLLLLLEVTRSEEDAAAVTNRTVTMVAVAV
jgi:hypothetical protein